METISVGGTSAATPAISPGVELHSAVEDVMAALADISPAEWALLAAFGVLAGVVWASRPRRAREDMTARLIRQAREHRANDAGGFDLGLLCDAALWVVAIAGLAVMLTSDSPAVHWTGAAVAAVCAIATVVVDWRATR